VAILLRDEISETTLLLEQTSPHLSRRLYSVESFRIKKLRQNKIDQFPMQVRYKG
jgi:hypothetical protein